jgi:serine/threonine protein kinase/Tol biopolymer transport system component
MTPGGRRLRCFKNLATAESSSTAIRYNPPAPMSLQPGTHLGPYEVLELAGAGGMGEVYKARDTRLDRIVAIKVLPPHASAIGDLKQRFEREAQTIASLKHPNICVLHDIGREAPSTRDSLPAGQTAAPSGQSGIDFIVMEYLQGETLAERIARERGRKSGATAAGGATPASGSSSAKVSSQTATSQTDVPAAGRALKLNEALGIAIQIADALDQAHQHGVIHRDLKPANVMLLPSSGGSGAAAHVKLLDFGLAKLTRPADAIESAETMHSDLTGPGMVLGTVRYMAPEQIEGGAVDARTDIFGFGCVLYEMLTGRKAFDGKTQASLIAAIINVDPAPVSALIPVAPLALERLVARCLAKDPDDRWQTAHDLLLQLRWIAGRGAKGGTAAATSAGARRDPLALAALAAGVLIIGAMAFPAYRYMQGAVEPDEFRFRIPAVGLSAADMAISPDGETIAMVARPGPETAALYVRPVNAVTFRKLAGTDNAAQPFWSPDSSTIGFVAGGRLKKVAAAGTPPQEIGALDGSFFGGTWGTDGTILYGTPAGIRRISAEGGAAETITSVEKPEAGHYWPTLLPDGKHYLYLSWSGETDKRAIFAGTLGSNDKTRLLAADSNPQYAPGYLLFRRDATVLAQPFDADQLTVSGGPTQIAGDVGFNLTNGGGYFSVSRAGTLIYFQGASGAGTGRAGTQAGWQFGWHDRTGRLISDPGEPGPYGELDASPDEQLIAITRQDPGSPGSDIWVMDWKRRVNTKVTLDPSDDMAPVWAPDGKRIAFVTYRKGNADIFVKNANGIGPETPLVETAADEFVEDWSKDGRFLAYKQAQGEFEDLYILPFDADGKPGKPFPIIQGPYHKDEPQFSYDGQWLAYVSDESGRFEVYVTSFPALDQKLKVTDEGGGRPRWRRDSKEILFLKLQSPVMAVDFMPGPKINAGIPHQLFAPNAPGGAVPTTHRWDVSADGQRFFTRTVASIAGGTATAQGGVPTVPSNFIPAGQTPATPTQAAPAISQPPHNGLTVIRHWNAAFRKGVK